MFLSFVVANFRFFMIAHSRQHNFILISDVKQTIVNRLMSIYSRLRTFLYFLAYTEYCSTDNTQWLLQWVNHLNERKFLRFVKMKLLSLWKMYLYGDGYENHLLVVITVPGFALGRENSIKKTLLSKKIFVIKRKMIQKNV